MPVQYKVVQGDHISGIAKQYGFADYKTVWQYADNLQLRQLRKTPDILLPGDIVVIPDLNERTVSRPADKRHLFRVSGSPLKLRLILQRSYGLPLSDTPCMLSMDSKWAEPTTDYEGKLEYPISKNIKDALLTVKDTVKIKGSNVPVWFDVPVRIGHMDPIDQPSGQLARLANLGYYRLDSEEPDPAEFRSAVEEFQCEHDLTIDGDCGPATQAKLKQVHGC